MILIIDDEQRWMRSYVETLQFEAIEVKLECEIESALNFFIKNKEKIDLVVIDCMMPPPATWGDAATNDGLDTGLLVIERIREEKPEVATVLLTNRDLSSLKKIKQNNIVAYNKVEMPPFVFAKKIKKILSKTKNFPKNHLDGTSGSDTSEEVFEIKPNFYGIGLNLRVLAKKIQKLVQLR